MKTNLLANSMEVIPTEIQKTSNQLVNLNSKLGCFATNLNHKCDPLLKNWLWLGQQLTTKRVQTNSESDMGQSSSEKTTYPLNYHMEMSVLRVHGFYQNQCCNYMAMI